MAHVFDLASNWTADTTILIVQGWYGIPSDDGGADPDYGNWDIDSSSWHSGDPSTYPAIPYANQDASRCNGGHRYIGSKLRPLTGIYSDSGREDNAASIAHIDRMLGVVERAGDPRGRVNVIACTLGLVQFTSHNGYEPGDADYTQDLDTRYRHLDKMLERANAAGLTNCVAANYEAYYIWQFFSGTYTSKLARLGAVALDLEDLVNKLKNDNAAWKVDGRVVICWYEGTLNIPGSGEEDITPAEWSATMEAVRTATGHDFFVIGRNYGASDVAWLDGLFPWIRYQNYLSADGSTNRLKASNWAQDGINDFIASAVAANSGRVALANFSPGFDDYVLEWGAGNTSRVIPRTSDTIKGQFDGYQALDDAGPRVDGLVLATWNGYPEGHCIEPTVQDNGEVLGLFTEQMAIYRGENPSASETETLLDIWRTATPSITCPVQYRQGGRRENVATGEALTSGHGTT